MKSKIADQTSLEFRGPWDGEEIELGEIRARSMRKSLEKAGRYDETAVRQRLLNHYVKEDTVVVIHKEKRVGFYVLTKISGGYYLNHLYIDTPFQNAGYGKILLDKIKSQCSGSVIKLNALKGSWSNNFYLKNGFIWEKEDEFDHYYVYKV